MVRMDDFPIQFPQHDSEFENQDESIPNPIHQKRKNLLKTIFNLPKERKILLSVAILGVFSLSFGIMRWFTSLRIPFAVNDVGKTVDLAKTKEDQNNLTDILKLQTQDTDSDGLSDYDELYTYKTSPYLEDTDSDGFSDSAEIEKGKDPNCPNGAVCVSEAGQESTLDLPESADNLTPNQIRQLLIESGMTQEQADAIDDSTLQQLYQEVLTEKSNAISSAPDNNSDSLLPDNAAALTAGQIRQLLKDQGATDEELKNVSDEELLAGWQEIISQSASGQLQENSN